MFGSVVMWNPINLIDGEAHWILWEIGFIAVALIVSKFLGIALRHMSKKINNPLFALFADAIYTPLIYLIWYLAALYTFDLITEEIISQVRPKLWAFLTTGGSILFLGWFLLRLKNRILVHAIEVRTVEGKSPDATSMQALSKLFTAVIGSIILILLNDFTGISLTTLLAFGGVGGLALAFASQEIVSNFFGGFMIHMTRPFLIGELVSMPSLAIEGAVEEIGWYQTLIRPSSKTAVYIPNSLFTKALLINKTRITHRLLDEPIYVQTTSLPTLELIAKDITSYLSSNPQFDQTEWAGSRIDFVGPISTIIISGLATSPTQQEFYHLRGKVLLHVANIVTARGGIIASPPQILSSRTV